MTLPKFRKKPVEIEAIQFDGSWSSARAIMDAFDTGPEVSWSSVPEGGNMVIETLEGNMWASPLDWIIRGIKGELYPCKPDIFEASYDPA